VFHTYSIFQWEIKNIHNVRLYSSNYINTHFPVFDKHFLIHSHLLTDPLCKRLIVASFLQYIFINYKFRLFYDNHFAWCPRICKHVFNSWTDILLQNFDCFKVFQVLSKVECIKIGCRLEKRLLAKSSEPLYTTKSPTWYICAMVTESFPNLKFLVNEP